MLLHLVYGFCGENNVSGASVMYSSLTNFTFPCIPCPNTHIHTHAYNCLMTVEC